MSRPSVYARYPRKGRTASEMAERAGKSVRTAQRWTSESRETYLARAAERHEQMRELRAKGLTLRAIAAELGCAASTVQRALKKDHPKSP